MCQFVRESHGVASSMDRPVVLRRINGCDDDGVVVTLYLQSFFIKFTVQKVLYIPSQWMDSVSKWRILVGEGSDLDYK